MSTIRLSVCLIVRDEAATLPRALESVREVAGEIIVVDTGSSDDTPAIARAAGADVIEVPWGDDFSAARNAGLACAHGTWILVLDADEWLAPEDRPRLRELVGRPPTEAFHLIQCSVDPEGGVVRAATVRLFPNRPDVRYRYALHEEVNASLHAAGLPLRNAPIELLHLGYANLAVVERKFARNRRIVDAALARGVAADEELHLRFYRACLNFDVQAWRLAVGDFEWCAAAGAAAPAGRVAAARLRAAQCHFELGDDARAAVLVPTEPAQATHPLMLALGARLASRRGATDEAARWYRALTGMTGETFSPPVALAPLQREAAEFLAAAGPDAGA